jgi:hypothetical protein
MTYSDFCETMAEAINQDAIAHGDSTVTVAEVMGMDDAVSAYIATCEIAENLSHV